MNLALQPVFSITLRTPEVTPLIEITAKIKGLPREEAIRFAQEMFPLYGVAFVIKLASEE